MKKAISLFYLLSFGLLLNAQKYDNTWLWGFKPELQDSTILRRGNSQGQFIGNNFIVSDVPREMIFDYTNHTFCDVDGNLLFYTNGMRIKDSASHNTINGDSLNYGSFWEYCRTQELQGYYSYSVAYSHFALPQPQHDSIFYLFHERADTIPPVWKGSMCYSVIKKRTDGKLEASKKNQLLSTVRPTCGGVNACRHANGRDWWILYMQVETNCVNKFLLTPDTLVFISSQCLGTTYDWTDGIKSYFSLDGSVFVKTGTAHGTDIYSFDRCSCDLQLLHHLNPVFEIDSFSGATIDYIEGSDLSANNRYLYLCMSRFVFQYDLEAPDVEASLDTVGTVDYFTDTVYASGGKYYFNFTQYGPDGKIYIGPKGGCRFMSTIDFPDSGGVSCHVGVRSVVLTKLDAFSLQFSPNYRLGRLLGSACDTIYSDIKPLYTQPPWLKVFPNPATDEVQFDYNWVEWESIEDLKLKIEDLSGRVVMEQQIPKYSTKQNFSVKQLAAGVYTVQLYGNGLSGNKVSIANCKLVKQ